MRSPRQPGGNGIKQGFGLPKRYQLTLVVADRLRNHHQPTQAQARQLGNLGSQFYSFIRVDTRLGQPAVHIDLQTDLQRRQMRGTLVAEPLGNLQPVNRVYPVKMLGYQAAFVALDRADAMPLKGQLS